MHLDSDDAWVAAGYAKGHIEPGSRPAVLVIDMQYAFTDPDFECGGSELILRATGNIAPLLDVARERGIPVFQTVVEWRTESDLGLWPQKLPFTRELTPGSRWVEVDERLWDPSDVLLPKHWPSFFNGTPLQALLTGHGCDTVIVTGCTTSGCVRATTVDAFSAGLRTMVPEDCVGDHGQDAHRSNLRDVHRRYAEVTSGREMIDYLSSVEPANGATVGTGAARG